MVEVVVTRPRTREEEVEVLVTRPVTRRKRWWWWLWPRLRYEE